MTRPSTDRRARAVDRLIALVLSAGTAVYLTRFPHHLGATDESLFLYEAKRIVTGEVMYRDFFEIVTPLAWYFMALMFRLFGTDMTTARITMASLCGLITVTIYLACRAVDVRQGFAIAAGLAFLAVSHPAWPYASPHWFSTLLASFLLLLLLRARWTERLASVGLLGVVSGMAIGVQQQKGVVLGAGIGTILIADFLASRRFAPEPWSRLWARVAALAAGVLAVVIPLAIVLVVAAGTGPVVKALIEFPLVNYRGSFRSAWGGVSVLSSNYAEYTFPTLLKFLPLILITVVARAVVDLLRASHRRELRQLTVLAIWCAFSMLSIAYYPDFIHVAFIAPVFFVAIAESLEWGVRQVMAVRAPRLASASSLTLSAIMLITLGWRMKGHLDRVREQFPISHETAFGEIAFTDDHAVLMIDLAREYLRQTPGAELFCYPGLTSPYLMTGGNNPTPYQMLSPQYSDPSQLAEVVSILRQRRVPYIIAAGLFLRPTDPVAQFIKEEYKFIPTPGVRGLGSLWLFGRKDLQPAPRDPQPTSQ